jgi:SAM-dependent methyltransferase
VATGNLRCARCGTVYAVTHGVVDFLVKTTPEVNEEIEGNALMVQTDRADCDDEWLLALPWSHTQQRPEMAVHDEEADLRALMAAVTDRGRLRVLDLGAGTCWTSQRWAAVGHDVIATDVSLEKYIGLYSADTFINHTGNYFERVRFDMNQRWPFASGTFDVVAAMSCIHHAQSLDFVFREARRVLDGSGRLLLVETTRSQFMPERLADFGTRERELFHRNERIYTQMDYLSAARDAGLRLQIRPAPSFIKKVELVASGRQLVGRNRLKHRLARGIRPLLRSDAVRKVVAGGAFEWLNYMFGSQFIGVARPAS